MWREGRSTRLETVSGSADRRLRALLAVGVLGGLVSASAARGEPTSLASLATAVVGSDRAAPGGTATFRIDVRSASPRMTVTVYEQLGSSLNFIGDRRDCVISALPAENLPGADPGAPGENRMACVVLTDDRGRGSLVLETRVSPLAVGPGSDFATRSVVAIEDETTNGVGPVASAEITLIGGER